MTSSGGLPLLGTHTGLSWMLLAILATALAGSGGSHLALLAAMRSSVSCSRVRVPSYREPVILVSVTFREPSGMGGPLRYLDVAKLLPLVQDITTSPFGLVPISPRSAGRPEQT